MLIGFTQPLDKPEFGAPLREHPSLPRVRGGGQAAGGVVRQVPLPPWNRPVPMGRFAGSSRYAQDTKYQIRAALTVCGIGLSRAERKDHH